MNWLDEGALFSRSERSLMKTLAVVTSQRKQQLLVVSMRAAAL